MRFEIQIIGARQIQAHTQETLGEIAEILFPVNMPEDADGDAGFLHDFQHMRRAMRVVVGRIMEHSHDLAGSFFFGHFDRTLHAAFFSQQYRTVVSGEIRRRLGKPPARPDERPFPHMNDIIVKKLESAARFPRHFRHGIPPVVVIAAHDDFPPGKRRNPIEVDHGLFQIVSPGEIARQDARVVLRDGFQPRATDFFTVIRPDFAEDVHRFRRRVAG